tara:strand:- start:2568 stop:2894 length:327 start_codon:yes stop_codon:yes gene_type:complete
MQKLIPKHKKGGVVTSTVMGVGGLIISVMVILVLTTTILNAELLGASENNTANGTAFAMQGNFTEGLNNISTKIPTILLIVAVVFLFGALVLLVRQASAMGIGGGSSL